MLCPSEWITVCQQYRLRGLPPDALNQSPANEDPDTCSLEQRWRGGRGGRGGLSSGVTTEWGRCSAIGHSDSLMEKGTCRLDEGVSLQFWCYRPGARVVRRGKRGQRKERTMGQCLGKEEWGGGGRDFRKYLNRSSSLSFRKARTLMAGTWEIWGCENFLTDRYKWHEPSESYYYFYHQLHQPQLLCSHSVQMLLALFGGIWPLVPRIFSTHCQLTWSSETWGNVCPGPPGLRGAEPHVQASLRPWHRRTGDAEARLRAAKTGATSYFPAHVLLQNEAFQGLIPKQSGGWLRWENAHFGEVADHRDSLCACAPPGLT